MGAYFIKLKEVFFSVLPITLIVIIIRLIPGALSGLLFSRFLIGAAAVTVGLSIFLYGVSIAITPLGEHIGAYISKKARISPGIIIGLVIVGFVINIAEPDLQILAEQVSLVTSGRIQSVTLLTFVSAGIGAMLVTGFIRYIRGVPLNLALLCAYVLIFILSQFVPKEFLGVAFDSSGATTGALTVPFLLALTFGMSSLKVNARTSEEGSFGLVAIASAGAIIAVLVMGICRDIRGLTGSLPNETAISGWISPFMQTLPESFRQSLLAASPICFILIFYQFAVFHSPITAFIKTLRGLIYALAGLCLFFTGINAGFMEVGTVLGIWISGTGCPYLLWLFGFLLGGATVIAEPAVHVLTLQIEQVTCGCINRRIVKAALSLGVGVAVLLSMIRIQTTRVELWHFLLPGYILALVLSFFTPKLFVGIGFDSGGVASGPMTATFILSFAQGAAKNTATADVFRDAFGMIAMVALTPILAIEILGLIYKTGSRNSSSVTDGCIQ